MLAYERSVALGSEVIDVDLELSADGVLVAHHDTTVDAQTNGHGAVAEMTLAELRALDAGWGFKLNGSYPYRGKGVTIPTLGELLDRFPNFLFSLDLKDLGSDIIAPVCAAIRHAGHLDRTFVGSDSDDQIFEFRRRCPDVRTSATLADALALWSAAAKGDEAFVPQVHIDQPPYRVGSRTLVDGTRLAFAHRHDVAILTWVVDDPATMKSLVQLGVDGIYTRRPDLLAPIVANARHHAASG